MAEWFLYIPSVHILPTEYRCTVLIINSKHPNSISWLVFATDMVCLCAAGSQWQFSTSHVLVTCWPTVILTHYSTAYFIAHLSVPI